MTHTYWTRNNDGSTNLGSMQVDGEVQEPIDVNRVDARPYAAPSNLTEILPSARGLHRSRAPRDILRSVSYHAGSSGLHGAQDTIQSSVHVPEENIV